MSVRRSDGPTEEERHNLPRLYYSCIQNAADLLIEAELLLERGRIARSFALAFTALEEISKSQLAADLFTGLIDFRKFKRYFWDHQKKANRMIWADLSVHGDLSPEEEESLRPKLADRSAALYVDLDERYHPVEPSEKIKTEDARSMIRVVDAALGEIYYATEVMGHQIGTNGFMK